MPQCNFRQLMGSRACHRSPIAGRPIGRKRFFRFEAIGTDPNIDALVFGAQDTEPAAQGQRCTELHSPAFVEKPVVTAPPNSGARSGDSSSNPISPRIPQAKSPLKQTIS